MKDFYSIEETGEVGAADYYEKKRETVLETIKPICEAFEISEYDYTIDVSRPCVTENLIVEGHVISCSFNSVGETVRELVIYIFVNCHGTEKLRGSLQIDAIRDLTRCW